MSLAIRKPQSAQSQAESSPVLPRPGVLPPLGKVPDPLSQAAGARLRPARCFASLVEHSAGRISLTACELQGLSGP